MGIRENGRFPAYLGICRTSGRPAPLRWRTVIPAPDIPGHAVTGVLGSGGFATVYRARQLAVGREVAVKIDNRVLLTDRDRRRFMREVTAAGQLSGHPNVIDVYDAGTLRDGRPYLVMELCPAGSLQDELRRRGAMSPTQVREIGISLADALAAAHQGGILHRDIKPANILINRYGMVGLSDFGLASIVAGANAQSATREALTPAYASPEAFRCQEPTVAGDVYSLAATLYALLAGRPPRFPASADANAPGFATIMALHDQPPEDIPGVPPALMALLRQSLAANPAARPSSAAALRDALAACRSEARGSAGTLPSGPGSASFPGLPPGSDRGSAPAPAPGPAPRSAPAPRSGSGRATPAHTGQRRTTLIAAAVAAGLAIAVAAAVVFGFRLLPGSGTAKAAQTRSPDTGQGVRTGHSDGVPGVFGIATVSKGCPAALVAGGRARCPAHPECWDGLVVISGNASAGALPCAAQHYWQTFAIALLPPDVQTFDQDIVQADPTVRRVCSMSVLLRSRRGPALRIPAASWEIQVLPPDETAFDSGARAYRCLASRIDAPTATTSQFGA